ncbi:MAG: hypothetical protein ABW202_00435 [Duganella sp.]
MDFLLLRGWLLLALVLLVQLHRLLVLLHQLLVLVLLPHPLLAPRLQVQSLERKLVR